MSSVALVGRVTWLPAPASSPSGVELGHQLPVGSTRGVQVLVAFLELPDKSTTFCQVP
jgi:hypothetical protein